VEKAGKILIVLAKHKYIFLLRILKRLNSGEIYN